MRALLVACMELSFHVTHQVLVAGVLFAYSNVPPRRLL